MARNKPIEDTQVPRRLWADDSLEFESNVEKAGSTAHRKKSRSAESSGSRRRGTPDSLGHMNEDGVAPRLDDNFGELEQGRADTKILSTDARVKSESDLDLYAFFDGLSRAEKAKVLKPLMAKSGLKPSKEVHPSVTSDNRCHPLGLNESHESLKKLADSVLRKQGNHSALLRERRPVGPERDIWGEDVHGQTTDKAWSDPWTAPVAIHQDKSWEEYSKPWKQHRSSSWDAQDDWAFSGEPKTNSWGSDDQKHIGGHAAYSAEHVAGTMTEAHEKNEKDKAARKAEREAKADAEEIARLQARVVSIHNAGLEPEQNSCQWSGMSEFHNSDAADPPMHVRSLWNDVPSPAFGTFDDGSVENYGDWSAPHPSSVSWNIVGTPASGDQEVALENSQPLCKVCHYVFDPEDWGASLDCCPPCNGNPGLSDDPIQSVNTDAAEGSAASEWGFDHGNPNKHKLDPTAPFKVNYWIHLESVNEEIYIPIDSKYVTGPEKHVIEGNMQKVWKWAQDKHMCDKLALEDAFDLAKIMTDDYIDEAAKKEGMDGPKEGLVMEGPMEGLVMDPNDTEIDPETGVPVLLKDLVQEFKDAGIEPVVDPKTATMNPSKEMCARMLDLVTGSLLSPPVRSGDASPAPMGLSRLDLEHVQAGLLSGLQAVRAEGIANGVPPFELNLPIFTEQHMPRRIAPRLAALKKKLDDLAIDGVPVPAYDDDGKLIFCKGCLELRWECTCGTA